MFQTQQVSDHYIVPLFLSFSLSPGPIHWFTCCCCLHSMSTHTFKAVKSTSQQPHHLLCYCIHQYHIVKTSEFWTFHSLANLHFICSQDSTGSATPKHPFKLHCWVCMYLPPFYLSYNVLKGPTGCKPDKGVPLGGKEHVGQLGQTDASPGGGWVLMNWWETQLIGECSVPMEMNSHGVTFLPWTAPDLVFTGYDYGPGCIISHGLIISGVLSHVWYWLIPRIVVVGLHHTLG